jgi:hypothetical protein
MTGDIHQPLHVGAAFVGKDGKFVDPKLKAEIDETAVFDSRGGNNFLLDDAKLTSLVANLSNVIPPEEAKPVKEGVPKALTKPFHSYWDSTTVNYAFRRIQTKTPEKFAQAAIDSKPAIAVPAGEPVTWPYLWAEDALVVSKQAFEGVTVGKIKQETSKKGETYYTWSLEVPQNYPVPSSQIAKEQLIKGGYHLAQLLQAVLK